MNWRSGIIFVIRSEAAIPEELAKKRLKGLLERAALREKGALNGVRTSETNSFSGSVTRLKVRNSDEGESSEVDELLSSKPIKNLEPADRKTGARPSRNSLLPEKVQNRWKRKAVRIPHFIHSLFNSVNFKIFRFLNFSHAG